MSQLAPYSRNELFLKSFHAQYPGCTSQTLATTVNTKGQSSYDLLADIVPQAARKLSVLDIACGDGYLLELLLMRGRTDLKLFGIDMSEEELSAARRRLDTTVDLRVGKAQSLPFADASMDFVICHMALMLMDSIEDVLNQVVRVLKPGGTFSAVISGPREQSAASNAFRNLLVDALKEKDLSVFKEIGDRRLDTEAEIQTLFAKDFSSPVQIRSDVMSSREALDSAVCFFMTYYGPGLLSAEERVDFESKLRVGLSNLVDADGKITCSGSIVQIIASRA